VVESEAFAELHHSATLGTALRVAIHRPMRVAPFGPWNMTHWRIPPRRRLSSISTAPVGGKQRFNVRPLGRVGAGPTLKTVAAGPSLETARSGRPARRPPEPPTDGTRAVNRLGMLTGR
jgi:hypothetical protein